MGFNWHFLRLTKRLLSVHPPLPVHMGLPISDHYSDTGTDSAYLFTIEQDGFHYSHKCLWDCELTKSKVLSW